MSKNDRETTAAEATRGLTGPPSDLLDDADAVGKVTDRFACTTWVRPTMNIFRAQRGWRSDIAVDSFDQLGRSGGNRFG